jgi:O-antigen ligase
VHYVCLTFVVFVTIGMFWSPDSETTFRAIRTYVQVTFVLWLAWEFARDHHSQIQLIRAYLLGCYVTIAGVYQSFQSGAAYENALGMVAKDRFSLPGSDPNDMALTIAIGLCLALYLVHTEGRLMWRLIAGGFVLVAPAAVIFTGSRGGVVASIIACCGVLPLFSKGRSGTKPAFAVLIITLVILSSLLIPGETLERISTIGTELNSGDLNGRTILWRGGLRAFVDEPILGSGAGTFHFVVPAGGSKVAHNTFLSVLVEEGLIGFIIFSAILTAIGVMLFRLPTVQRFYCVLTCCVWATGVSTLTWEQRRVTWLLFAFLIGLATPERQPEERIAEPMLLHALCGENS